MYNSKNETEAETAIHTYIVVPIKNSGAVSLNQIAFVHQNYERQLKHPSTLAVKN